MDDFGSVRLNISVFDFSSFYLPFSPLFPSLILSLPLSRPSFPAAPSSEPEDSPVQRGAGSELGAGVPEQ